MAYCLRLDIYEVEAVVQSTSFPLADFLSGISGIWGFERIMLESFRSTIAKASRIEPVQVRLKAYAFGRVLLASHLLDFVSVYLAFLKGLIPSNTPWDSAL